MLDVGTIGAEICENAVAFCCPMCICMHLSRMVGIAMKQQGSAFDKMHDVMGMSMLFARKSMGTQSDALACITERH